MKADNIRILNCLIDGRMGGPQHRALLVANRLQNEGIETEFLIAGTECEFRNRAVSQGFNIHQPGISQVYPLDNIKENIAYLYNSIRDISKIYNIIYKRGIDIVHVNASHNLQPAIAAYISGAKVVWHFNDELLPAPYKNICAAIAKKMSNQIIVASNQVYKYYFNGNASKEIIPAPVDLERFDPKFIDGRTEANNVKSDRLVIGTVGNLNPIKGHAYFIDSINLLNKEIDTDVYAPIAGAQLDTRGEYFDSLKEKVETLRLEDDIDFVGYVEEMAKFLYSLDIFALSSVSEASPMVLLEAMAMECKIVATDVGGVPEIIDSKSEGLTVEPKCPEALKEGYLKIINNSYEQIPGGSSARRRVAEKFSLSNCVDNHKHIYRQVI